ncbi:hypothetical protein IFU40_06045 [Microbacterium sp. CFBP 13617]|uniref:hypothetical protein n=1 Tax=Microbacterium sp. CFBP 13617 TaxID=2774035 RepID=UPI0017862CB4|nr:hypothetical protein [Microbacterium sp. CFBP 13617]MBD8218193.1 hypothetical protein [Microbacterium sp. CFBP 13617]
MGHSKGASGAITVTPTPTQTVADMQAIANRVEEIGGLIAGTAAQRAELTSAEVRNGWIFAESDTGRLFWRRNNAWVRLSPVGGGFVVDVTSTKDQDGATNDGIITVTHGLGFTPRAVVVTDRNEGGVPSLRKVVVTARNATQIQFAVYVPRIVKVGDNYDLQAQLLPNNPVEFDWIAFQ